MTGRIRWASRRRTPARRMVREAQRAGVPGSDQRDPGRQRTGRGAGEVDWPEKAEERVPHHQVPRVAAVEPRVPAVTGPEPVRDPVAAHVPVLEHPVVQPGAHAPFDLRPYLVSGDIPVVLVPAALVADERGWLEGEHAIPHRRQSATTPATCPTLPGVTVMLWARKYRTLCSRRSRANIAANRSR